MDFDRLSSRHSAPRPLGHAIVPLAVLLAAIGCTPPATPPASRAPADPAPSEAAAPAEAAPVEPSDATARQAATPGEEPPDQPEATKDEPPSPEAAEEPPSEPPAGPEEQEGELDFGQPLLDGLGKNERLDPKQPVWLTGDRKSVVVQAMVCQRQAPLEMFACLLNSKEHESVLTVPVKAFTIHAGLLAAGAVPGTPVRWDPEYAPPTGTEIEITVHWKDEQGNVRKARGQDWVRDLQTGKAMTQAFVFAGSTWFKDDESGTQYYGADSGDLICVSNFATAMLDVPIRSSDANASLMFEAFTENIPPLGTPVTMVLTPKLDPARSPKEPAEASGQSSADVEQADSPSGPADEPAEQPSADGAPD